MTVSKLIVTAVMTIPTKPNLTLDVISTGITMDKAWSPYGQATLTAHAPAQAILETIDPRAGCRVTITVQRQQLSTWNPGTVGTDQIRTYSFGLRSRRVDRATGDLVLTLATDEALLQDKALVTTAPERVTGLAVDDAVRLALSKIGSPALVVGALKFVTANEPEPTVINLARNPSAETALTHWASNSGATLTLARSNEQAHSGTWSVKATSSSTAGGRSLWAHASTGAGSEIPADVGDVHTASAWVRLNNLPPRNMQIAIRFFSAADAVLGTVQTEFVVPRSTWTRIHVSASAPIGATKIGVLIASTYMGPGQSFYVDDVMVNTGELTDYSDGSLQQPGLYQIVWNGTAHNSSSTKTWLPNSDAMIWNPGVTAWDYLTPILQAADLRLNCDELGTWYLDYPNGLPDFNSVAITKPYAAVDTIDRESEEWFDSVLIEYRWRVRTEIGRVQGGVTRFEASEVERVAYDVAGAPGTKTLILRYDTPYPGAGAAAGILERALAKGREIIVDAAVNITARPNQPLTLTAPDTPPQKGFVAAVRWSYPADVMTITPRALEPA